MLLEVNLTMIIFAISFLIFIYLLNLTLFKPVGKIVGERKNLIEGSYEKSKELSHEANKIIEDHEKKIKEIRLSAKNIVEAALLEAKRKREEKVSVLMESLLNEKEAAVVKIKQEEKVRKEELNTKINELKDLITNKVLGTEENSLVGSH